MSAPPRAKRSALVAIGQGLYWFVTGIWPLLHLESFLAVTGPKQDLWLVRTVGELIAVIGGVLLAAGLRRRITPEIVALGIASAAALAFIDVYYAFAGVIDQIYLADAVAEAALISLWIWARTSRKYSREPLPRED